MPKKPAPKARSGGDNLDLGALLMEANQAISGVDDDDDVEIDPDLEAELLALHSDSPARKQPPAAAKKPKSNSSDPSQLSLNSILSDVTAALGGDLESVDSGSVGDSEEGDLAAELQELMGASDDETPTADDEGVSLQKAQQLLANKPKPSYGNQLTVIEERLKMYHTALVKARDQGEGSRVKRYTRQLKTLEDQRKMIQAGKLVRDEDIPPPISLGAGGGGSSQDSPNPNLPSGTTTTATSGIPSSSSGSEHSPTTDLTHPQPSQSAAAASHKPQVPAAAGAKASDSPLAGRAAAPPSTSQSGASCGLVSGVQSEDAVSVLRRRQHEYKVAAQQANLMGDKHTALSYVRVIKGFEEVILAAESGREIDVSNLPGPPPLITKPVTVNTGGDLPPQPPPRPQHNPGTPGSNPGSSAPDGDLDPNSRDPLEALTVRMNVFKRAAEKAKQENDTSKARRQERLMKQYADAIRAYKANRPVPWDNLCNPVGFPPFPGSAADAGGSAAAAQSASAPNQPTDPIASLLEAAAEQMTASAAAAAEAGSSSSGGPPPSAHAPPQQPAASSGAVPKTSPAVPPSKPSPSGAPPAPAPGSKTAMTVEFLTSRQLQYRKAAVVAKKRGDETEAKRYLRLCKGFDPMISAASKGLPIDLSQVPPALAPNKMSLAAPDPVQQQPVAAPKHNADPEEVASLFASIENQLKLQAEKCQRDAEYYSQIGELASVTRAEKMLQQSCVDLNLVQANRLRGELPPRMHYEQRAFTRIKVNSDINDGEVEVSISRAINLPCPEGLKGPADLTTMAKFEFPWPPDSPSAGQTSVVRCSDCPVYNLRVKLPISDRKDRMSRHLKRRSLDITVYYQKGLFKSMKPLGVASVKLDVLDRKSQIHEAVVLMDPTHSKSRATAGKLEVGVRVREPFSCRDTEEVVEKWLVVDAELTPQVTAAGGSQQAGSQQAAGGGGKKPAARPAPKPPAPPRNK